MMCKASNVCKVRNRQNDPQNECVCPSIPTPFYLKKKTSWFVQLQNLRAKFLIESVPFYCRLIV